MEVERYRKESIANQTVYLPQIILQWPWTKVIQNSAATFKRVIGNTAISLQPMLGTWIIFDNDRFDLDGKKLKLQEALVVG
jgi:hypothetical protein